MASSYLRSEDVITRELLYIQKISNGHSMRTLIR